MTDYFTEIMVMDLPHSDKALTFLYKIADDVEPLMRSHNWKVPLLVEFYEPTLLGTNAGRGEKISIRLRETTDGADFFPYSEVLDTMLHELTHNEYDEHDQDFYDFLEQLRVEHRSSRSGQPDPVSVHYVSCGGCGFPVVSPYGGYYNFGGSTGGFGPFGDYVVAGATTVSYDDYGEGGAATTAYGDYDEGGTTTTNYGGATTTSYGDYDEGGATTTSYGDYDEGGATTTSYGDYGEGGATTTTYGDYGETNNWMTDLYTGIFGG